MDSREKLTEMALEYYAGLCGNSRIDRLKNYTNDELINIVYSSYLRLKRDRELLFKVKEMLTKGDFTEQMGK